MYFTRLDFYTIESYTKQILSTFLSISLTVYPIYFFNCLR